MHTYQLTIKKTNSVFTKEFDWNKVDKLSEFTLNIAHDPEFAFPKNCTHHQ